MHFFFKSTRHLLSIYTYLLRLPRWFSGKESARFDPWVEKIPWNRKWQPTQVFLRGKSHGQSSLRGYSPWGHKERDMTEHKRSYTLTRQEEKGMTEAETVGWHHQLDGHEFEQALGSGNGQESPACYSPWGHKELDTTERLN